MTLLPVGLAPSDDVALVLQVAGVGVLVGTALAARRRMRDPTADTWFPPAMWALTFAAIATVVVLLRRVL